MNLLRLGDFNLSSAIHSDFKIDCDALSASDWKTIARLISEKFKFKEVFGVPTGALKLEKALKKYATPDEDVPYLIVDDVLTTGESISNFRVKKANELGTGLGNFNGVVVFSRCEETFEWIAPIFDMWSRSLEMPKDAFLEDFNMETVKKV